jgi:LacI family transcriptional regulator
MVFKRELGCSPRGYQQRARKSERVHDARDHFESRLHAA